ncbi:G-protein-signaling modulator 1-like [Stylophora pistillata]|uniref:G-protein-signaling modulator 1-like n=1 Tax=Stylophora pistillata TaxID=50429 RepID=UPI000C04CB00|nr:G-protein-signaling modulator 1-like [Stylophora pistillata]
MENTEEILQALFIGISVASVLLQTCRYRKAIELFTECLEFLNQCTSKLEAEVLKRLSALVYSRLSYIYFHIGDFKNGFENIELAKAMYPQMGGNECTAEDLDRPHNEHVSKAHDSPGKEEDEEVIKILSLARNVGDKVKEACVLNMCSQMALSRFEYFKARPLLERLAELYGDFGDRKQERLTFDRLGDLCKSLEEYDQAQKYHELVLLMAEEDEDTYMQGAATGKLGTLYNLRRDYVKAKDLRKKALEISVKIGDKKGEIIDNRFLSGVLLNLDKFKEARDCCLKALALSKEIDDKNQEASAYSDLGDVHRKLKDFEMAEHCHKRAIELYEETGDLENE